MRRINAKDEVYKKNIHLGIRKDINGVTLSRRD